MNKRIKIITEAREIQAKIIFEKNPETAKSVYDSLSIIRR